MEPDQLRFFASLFVQFYVKREDELRDDLLFFVKLTEDKSSSTTNVEQDQVCTMTLFFYGSGSNENKPNCCVFFRIGLLY